VYSKLRLSYQKVILCCCRDIAELTQQINRLDNHLNVLSEQNEALRERCGVGSEDTVDVAPLRSRRSAELEQLKRNNHELRLQVQENNDCGQFRSYNNEPCCTLSLEQIKVS
jgi:predicted RNase H-like nuclease (RuvC/YqgF family)